MSDLAKVRGAARESQRLIDEAVLLAVNPMGAATIPLLCLTWAVAGVGVVALTFR